MSKRFQLTRAAANRSYSDRTAKCGEAHTLTDAMQKALQHRYQYELILHDTQTGLKAHIHTTRYISRILKDQNTMITLTVPLAWAEAMIAGLND